MTKSTNVDRQSELIEQAEAALNASLDFFKQAIDAKGEDADEMEAMRTLQLVIQYRMDVRNVLHKLVHCQQSLLAILGISAQNSASINLERLTYAIGSDELHQLLLMLSKLVDALLRTIKKLHHKDKPKSKRPQKNVQQSKRQALLVKALDRQKSFAFIIAQLTQNLQVVAGAPTPGSKLDHISQLQGPISRFFQAWQNGLVLSAGIFQQLSKATKIEKSLGETLREVQSLLDKSNHYLDKPKLFTPSTPLSQERLQERSEAKRLGNFFNL